MNKFRKGILLWSLVLLLAACGGKSENRKIQEAASVHMAFMDRYDSLYHTLQAEKERIEIGLQNISSDDSRRAAYESMQRSIEKSLSLLNGWENAVVGVPGLKREHHHHGEGEHHHHEDEEALLNSMSDAEILELQKAYSSKLDELTKEITSLLDAIKQYDAQPE